MKIVCYPHPALRHKSKPVQRVDKQLRKIVREMFELMYEANGVGLAANQVELPFRLFVANLAAKPDDGEEYVFINPVIHRPRGMEEKEEGCLSLPGLYGLVKRPEWIEFSAYNLQGDELTASLDGLMARVVQHETDHLDGLLFIDRLSTSAYMETEAALKQFASQFEQRREQREIPSDQEIAHALHRWEREYC